MKYCRRAKSLFYISDTFSFLKLERLGSKRKAYFALFDPCKNRWRDGWDEMSGSIHRTIVSVPGAYFRFMLLPFETETRPPLWRLMLKIEAKFRTFDRYKI